LGDLKPTDVQVELYFGNLNQKGEIEDGAALPMHMVENRVVENISRGKDALP
jgi:hypothetical protein